MKKVMFVCLGNICRSPLAHACFEQIVDDAGKSAEYEIESSGTSGWHVGELPDSRMRETAGSHGVTMSHQGRQFKKRDFLEYDYIFPMDHSNKSDLLSMAQDPEAEKKVRLLREFDPEGSGNDPVPDPYYGGMDGFEEVFSIVDRSCRELFKRLEAGSL